MSKRRTADQIVRLLREADRDLVKGLTVADICRQHVIADNTYYRWRQLHDPAKVDDARRVREREAEVERLKLLVAELLREKKCSRTSRKKSDNRLPATCRRWPPPGGVSGLRTESQSGAGPAPPDAPLSPSGSFAGGAAGPGYPPPGPPAPVLGLPADSRTLGANRLAGQTQTGPPAGARAELAAARAPATAPETGQKVGDKRQQLRESAGAVQERPALSEEP